LALKEELAKRLEERLTLRQSKRIADIFPDSGPLRRELYPKHLEFLAAGKDHRERAMMAGNRTGKSLTAAYEVTCHATGDYPDWWAGKRFQSPVTCWAAGESVRDVRDSAQALLLGPPGGFGTGLIPRDRIRRFTARTGTPDATDTIFVRHKSGGTSRITMKTYEAGRESFQAASVHVVWMDEEPPMDVYVEALMRTATTEGIVLCTFTPLKGLSDTALRFLPDGKGVSQAQDAPHVTFVDWSDIPHLSEDAKRELLATIPPVQRDARTKGIPQLGAGAIYPILEEEFVIKPVRLEAHWLRAYALDVGWNRTAALFCAWDRETDTIYAYDEIYKSEAEPAVIAEAIKARGGKWMQGVIDPASRGRQQSDGSQLMTKYIQLGLNLSIANNAVEAGIFEVWQRLSTNRFKVVETLQNFRTEIRIYRRDEKGRVVKERDHLMDTARYFVMSGKDVAMTAPNAADVAIDLWAERLPGGTKPAIARKARHIESEYDPFAGMDIE